VGLPETVNEWFLANRRDLPWRREGFGAWGILVSEIMLQQTPVARVIPRLQRWLARWPTPSALAAASPGDAVREWERLGYPRRALNLHAAAVAITRDHSGEVPRRVEELLALPGIGDYTARAVAVFAFGDRHPVVDTNVRRVIARAVDGVAAAAPARPELAAMEALLPAESAAAALFNAAMMELGAIICTARAPRCNSCPIADSCLWRRRGYPPSTERSTPAQKRFDGSDRQVRGLVLAELRASYVPLTAADLAPVWNDAPQRERAIASLLTDGLAVLGDEGYSLP
jgi:A/G-specific adenine glycosylase